MNKILQRVMSVVLSLVILCGAVIVPGYATTGEAGSDYVYDEGHTPLTTVQFVSYCDTINNAFEALLGIKLIPEEKLKVEVNGFLNEILAGITESTGSVVDCQLIIDSLPSLKGNSNEIKSLLKIDMSVVDPALKKMADEYYAQDNVIAGFVITFLRAYLKTIDSCELYSVPVEGENGKFELFLTVNYEYGEPDGFSTGIVYDSVNGTLNSKNNTGVLDLGFVLDTEDYLISTAVNSWQRNFGFTMVYDIFCYITKIFDYVTVRVKFEYDNREWMVQLWKGKYLVAPGGEIGIYTREIGAPGTFYNCAADEDMMVMSMKLYHHDDLLFEMEPTLHWWLTGFKLHPKAYAPESLTLHGTIDFPTVEMANLFVTSAAETGEIKTTQNGANVAFVW
ncbi:MAG: DUF4474 domain-containing protein [Clostridia bacterium]|nr:DUF4474 domain-containing protein [Clostridia bacterium]